MRQLVLTSLFFLSSILLAFAHLAPQPLKLAIFDNPQVADSSNNELTEALEKAYMQGVNVAAHVARQQGYPIQTRSFFYNKNLLNIFQQVPLIKAWNPDVIIGLHTSNEALMAKAMFTKRLVLSITATDKSLIHLSSNFYTLGVPDPYISEALIKFINKNFPHRNLFIMIGVESKESLDFGKAVANDFTKTYPHHTAVIKEFLTNDLLSMNPQALLKGYHSNDIILMFSIAGTYQSQLELMSKLANYLAPEKPTFITTVDNWKNDVTYKNLNLPAPSYNAYRITNLYIDKSSPSYRRFSKTYKDLYHYPPRYTISYFTYRATMSVVTALKNYPISPKKSLKETILESYHKAIDKNPNWFRPMTLGVYRILPPKELYVDTISLRKVS